MINTGFPKTVATLPSATILASNHDLGKCVPECVVWESIMEPQAGNTVTFAYKGSDSVGVVVKRIGSRLRVDVAGKQVWAELIDVRSVSSQFFSRGKDEGAQISSLSVNAARSELRPSLDIVTRPPSSTIIIIIDKQFVDNESVSPDDCMLLPEVGSSVSYSWKNCVMTGTVTKTLSMRIRVETAGVQRWINFKDLTSSGTTQTSSNEATGDSAISSAETRDSVASDPVSSDSAPPSAEIGDTAASDAHTVKSTTQIGVLAAILDAEESIASTEDRSALASQNSKTDILAMYRSFTEVAGLTPGQNITFDSILGWDQVRTILKQCLFRKIDVAKQVNDMLLHEAVDIDTLRSIFENCFHVDRIKAEPNRDDRTFDFNSFEEVSKLTIPCPCAVSNQYIKN